MKSLNRVILLCMLAVLFFFTGCSRHKIPHPPKVQPELLLEIYKAVQKHQYSVALNKIEKLKTLDPTSVVLGELEHIVIVNRLSSLVNYYIKRGDFKAAFDTIEQYEKTYGSSLDISQVKNQIFLLSQLDAEIAVLKSDTANSETCSQALHRLNDLQKEMIFSPKIVNFIAKKRSMIQTMKLNEHDNVLDLLRVQAVGQFLHGKELEGNTLLAVLTVFDPSYSGLQTLNSIQNLIFLQKINNQ